MLAAATPIARSLHSATTAAIIAGSARSRRRRSTIFVLIARTSTQSARRSIAHSSRQPRSASRIAASLRTSQRDDRGAHDRDGRLEPRHEADDGELSADPAESDHAGCPREERGVPRSPDGRECGERERSTNDAKEDQARNEVIVKRTAREPRAGNAVRAHEAIYAAGESVQRADRKNRDERHARHAAVRISSASCLATSSSAPQFVNS